MAVATSAEMMQTVVLDQQAQIDDLRQRCESIRDDYEALRECLESSCILQRERFLAMVHRRRFTNALLKHPCRMNAAPLDVLRLPELLDSVCRFAGGPVRASCAAVAKQFGCLNECLSQRLYAIGGADSVGALSNFDSFDSRSGTWQTLEPMPTRRSNLVACACNGRIYAIGGTDGEQVLNAVEEYSPSYERWKSLMPMPTARSGMAASALDGHVYVVGGRVGFRSLGTVERLTPTTTGSGAWETLPRMRHQRRFLAAATLWGQVYAIGGEDDCFAAMSTVEKYTPSSNQWQLGPPMPTKRRGLAAVALKGRLYAVGGGEVTQPHDARTFDVVEVYDPMQGCWNCFCRMTLPRMFLAAVPLSGWLHVLGGSDGTQAHCSLERHVGCRASSGCQNCAASDGGCERCLEVWQTLAPMRTPRVFLAAATVCG